MGPRLVCSSPRLKCSSTQSSVRPSSKLSCCTPRLLIVSPLREVTDLPLATCIRSKADKPLHSSLAGAALGRGATGDGADGLVVGAKGGGGAFETAAGGAHADDNIIVIARSKAAPTHAPPRFAAFIVAIIVPFIRTVAVEGSLSPTC